MFGVFCPIADLTVGVQTAARVPFVSLLQVFTAEEGERWNISKGVIGARFVEMHEGVRVNRREQPIWMFDDVWTSLLSQWNSPHFRSKCIQNQKNQTSNTGGSLHIGGSISTHEHAIRMVCIHETYKLHWDLFVIGFELCFMITYLFRKHISCIGYCF